MKNFHKVYIKLDGNMLLTNLGLKNFLQDLKLTLTKVNLLKINKFIRRYSDFKQKRTSTMALKQKLKKVTKSVKGLDAIKKGIKEDKNLPAYYDLKFIHPPVINLKRIKHVKDVDGKYLKKYLLKKLTNVFQHTTKLKIN